MSDHLEPEITQAGGSDPSRRTPLPKGPLLFGVAITLAAAILAVLLLW